MTNANQLFQLHADWVPVIRQRLRMTYGTGKELAAANNLNPLTVTEFISGNGISPEDFKEICSILDFDWESVQLAWSGDE
jgi:hypothetical protein